MNRTGIFPGTFNPVHRGHESLARSFLNCGMIDELWIVLTPSPPHKSGEDLIGFEGRNTMLEIVFSGWSRVALCDLEKDMPPPHYTIRTVQKFREFYPEKTFFLCIGADTLQTMPQWYRFSKISQYAGLLVAGRPGVSSEVPEELSLFSISFCRHTPTGISSSDIRARIANGQKPGEDELHPDVYHLIQRNAWYR